MSVIPLRVSVNLLPPKPNTARIFVKPESIRRPISNSNELALPKHSGRKTATESIGRRLERVAESVVESEKKKLKAKLGGEILSEEQILSVQTMCEEIVGQFFEAPTEYLRSGGCCHSKFGDRVSDLELLADILEETCLFKP